MRWDVWRRLKEGAKRLSSVDLDAEYDEPEVNPRNARIFSRADMLRIERALREPRGTRPRDGGSERHSEQSTMRGLLQNPPGRSVLVQLRSGSLRLYLRPPMTAIFDLARDPSYVEGSGPEGDGARLVWALSPAWLESHATLYQGNTPVDAYEMPVPLADIPSARFYLLRVAIDHYLETGKPLP